ncbi:MAG: hypothetical protein JW795_03940 [Chitinivibrionales bacterium]|nr:hypothetical protein [Chitinivibrionales bacterium]
MLLHFEKNTISCICAHSVLTVILISFSTFAQSPLIYREIINHVHAKQSEIELIKKIERQKVGFELSSSDSVNLLRAGASDKLLRAIMANRIIVKAPITFNGWRPFGEIAIAPCNKNANVLCRGRSNAYPGLMTLKAFNVTNHTTLVVKIEGSAASTFTNQNKMLKVTASESNVALQCTSDSLLAPDDREFIVKRDGEFRYRIPESIKIGGQFQKLGFQFGPGEYKTFKMSAWFE